MKRIVVLLVGLLVLLPVIALVAPYVVSLDRFKGEIAELVQKQTGRSIVLDGPLRFSLLPWIGASAQKVALGNAAGFGNNPMVALESLEVRVKLLPLLEKRVEVERILLKGLQVQLQRDGAGKSNWDDLIAPPHKPESSTVPAAPSSASPALPLAGLLIGGLEITDGTIHWQDQAAGQEITVQEFSVKSGLLAMGQPLPLVINGKIQSGAIHGQFAVDGTLQPDLLAQELRIPALRLTLSQFTGGSLPSVGVGLTVQTDALFSLAQQSLEVREFHLTAMEKLHLQGSLHGTQMVTHPTVQGDFVLAAFNPRELLQSLGIPSPVTADAAALTKAEMRFTLQGSDQRLMLDGLRVLVDETTFQGAMGVDDLQHGVLRLTLRGDTLDLDRYLPKSDNKTTASAPATAAVGVAATPWVVPQLAPFRAINLHGEVGLAQLKVNQAHYEGLSATFAAEQGLFRLDPVKASLPQGTFSGSLLADLRSDTPKIALQGKLAGHPIAPRFSLETTVQTDAGQGKIRLTGARASLAGQGEGGGAGVEFNVLGEIETDPTQRTVAVKDLQVTGTGDLRLTGTLHGGHPAEGPMVEGELLLASMNPRLLMQRLGLALPVMADATTLGRLSGQLTFHGDPGKIELPKIEVKLDESRLTGRFSLNDFKKPVIRTDLQLDQIDLDRYLPPDAPGERRVQGTKAVTASETAAFHLASLRNTDTRGTLRADRIKADHGQFTHLQMTVNAKDGLVRVDPLTTELYQGTLLAKATLDVRGDTPLWSGEKHLKGVQIGPLVKDMAGKDILDGVAEITANFTARGEQADAIKRSLNGQAKMEVKQGALKGVDFTKMIKDGASALTNLKGNGPPAEKTKETGSTPFSELSGSAEVRNGVVENKDLQLLSPVFTATGKGTVDLPQELLDYLFTIHLTRGDLQGVEVPIHMHGNLHHPEFGLDASKLAEKALQNKVGQKLEEKLQEKLGDKAPPVKELLKGLGLGR